MLKQKVGRPKRSYAFSRVNLEMRDDIKDRVQAVKRDMEAGSMATVLERAFIMYEYVHSIKKDGGEVFVQKEGADPFPLKLS